MEWFKIWAPSESPWSVWAKPVLFSFMNEGSQPSGHVDLLNHLSWKWLPQERTDTALILDLEGEQSVLMALHCAKHGYRPVPLFNACDGPSPLLDQGRLIDCLHRGTADLASLALTPSAPPVFMLDSRRMKGMPEPKRFDNRWMVFPQDFPSARFLKSKGIQRACLVQNGNRSPQDDLAHILAAWQEQGIELLWDNLQDDVVPQPLQVRKPSFFKSFFYRTFAMMGFKKSSAGGFGMWIPEPSQSTGYG